MNDFGKVSVFRKNATWFAVLIAFIIFGFLLFKGWDKVVNEEIDGSVTTITGNFSCLSKVSDTPAPDSGCVLGVRSRDNLHYALDISRIQDANTDLKAEDTIAVTGTLRPVDPNSEWASYSIDGIILVNTLLRTR